MYSKTLLAHFRTPVNVGQLEPPATTVEVTNPVCGDILRLSVLWVDGKAEDVRFKARGCTASIAAGSALTQLIEGKARVTVRGLTAADVEAALDGLPNESKHAAALCMDAALLVSQSSE